MKYHVRDWINILIMLVFAPICFGVLYMVLASSVFDVNEGFIYLGVRFVVFLWMVVNAFQGYVVDSHKMTVSYPCAGNLFRKKIDFHRINCYELIGFDEYSLSDGGVGLSRFKIILKGDFGQASLKFSRRETAIAVFNALKKSVPVFGVKEGEYLSKN